MAARKLSIGSGGRWRKWASICLGIVTIGCTPPGNTLGWQRSDGTMVVKRAVKAHGGVDRWRSFDTVTFRYHENWSKLFAPFSPWPQNPVDAKMKLWLHTGAAGIWFDRHANSIFLYRDRQLLAEYSAGGQPPALDWKGEFALPRTHYITLLPFKFLDGGARIEYLGADSRYNKVLVTFPPGVGDTSEDRYWAFFDRETGRLQRVILTVTAYGPFAVGDLRYEDYVKVEGLLMPGRIRAMLNGPGLPLHVGEYSEWDFEAGGP